MPYKDKEKEKAYQRAWYKKNKDRLKLENRNYYYNNLTAHRYYKKKYYRKNIETILQVELARKYVVRWGENATVRFLANQITKEKQNGKKKKSNHKNVTLGDEFTRNVMGYITRRQRRNT